MSEKSRRNSVRKKCDLILKTASGLADEVSIFFSAEQSALTRFGENEITQNVSSQSEDVSIMLAKGGRSTKVQTDILEPSKLRPQLEQAAALLKYQRKDPEYPDFASSGDFPVPQGAYCENTAEMTPEDRAKPAISLIKRCEREKLLASGVVSNSDTRMALANSKGLFAYFENTGIRFSTTVMDDKGCSGWAAAYGKDVGKIDFEQIGSQAMEKSQLSRKPRDIETGDYPVILEPAAVTDFLLFLGWHGFSTQAYCEDRSPFKKQLGKKILDSKLTILDDSEDPLNPSLPFDFEGSRRLSLKLVDKGVFKEMPLDARYGKKLKKPANGHALDYPNSNGPMCMSMKILPGKRPLDKIIAESDKCLLITHFHYTNIINPNDLTITGTTRDGLYWIEKGRIAYPVKNMRFTESVIRALNKVEEISSEQVLQSAFFGGGFVVPGMKISAFRFTSKTDY
ncbi:MAG: TldD/PmbA family protein [Candidatus Wallbacteria bacterium]|nr:TldD/PmbA family protein [Candidatus Wallbacteria bacterium]